MAWQENFLSNLLALGIIVTLGIIIYCKIKGITFIELIKSIKETSEEI